MHQPNRRKAALVCEGGGLKAAYVCGAINQLIEDGGFDFDLLIGASSSAPSLAYLCCGIESFRSNLSIWTDELFHGAFPRGLLDLRTYFRLRNVLDYDKLMDLLVYRRPIGYREIMNSPAALVIPVSDVETGIPAYYSTKKLRIQESYPHLEIRVLGTEEEGCFWEVLRASITVPIPFVSKPVQLDKGRYFCDGGILAPVPIYPALAAGDRQLVVIVTKPENYQRRNYISNNFEGFRWIISQRTSILRGQYQKVFEKWNQNDQECREQIESLRKKDRAIVIRPAKKIPLTLYTSSLSGVECLIEQGRQDAMKALLDYRKRTGEAENGELSRRDRVLQCRAN